MAKPKSVNKSAKKPVSKSPAKARPAAAAAMARDARGGRHDTR